MNQKVSNSVHVHAEKEVLEKIFLGGTLIFIKTLLMYVTSVIQIKICVCNTLHKLMTPYLTFKKKKF